MVHIKDLLRLLVHDETITAAHARTVPVVPETAELDTVLTVMRHDRTQMAVVIDEHGGTAGVVTLEDLFEEVVGDIEEGPTAGLQVYRDREGRLRVPGTMRLDEVGRHFDLDLEHEDVDSVSGLILTVLGRPPLVSDSVKWERLQFEVTAVKGHGVEEAAVCLTDMDPGPPEGIGF
jgi:CBS domain containing-hemolysin-like protein